MGSNRVSEIRVKESRVRIWARVTKFRVRANFRVSMLRVRIWARVTKFRVRANFRVSMLRVRLRLRAKMCFKVGQP